MKWHTSHQSGDDDDEDVNESFCSYHTRHDVTCLIQGKDYISRPQLCVPILILECSEDYYVVSFFSDMFGKRKGAMMMMMCQNHVPSLYCHVTIRPFSSSAPWQDQHCDPNLLLNTRQVVSEIPWGGSSLSSGAMAEKSSLETMVSLCNQRSRLVRTEVGWVPLLTKRGTAPCLPYPPHVWGFYWNTPSYGGGENRTFCTNGKLLHAPKKTKGGNRMPWM